MEMTIFETTNLAVLVPIVVALTEVVKRMGFDNRFAPLISIGFGVILAVLFNSDTFTQNWGEIILQGLIYGLSASGLYSGVKTLKEDGHA